MSNPHVTVTVKCANCGTVKGEANHWLMVVRYVASYSIAELSNPAELKDEAKPICSQACAHAELDKWMTASRNKK